MKYLFVMSLLVGFSFNANAELGEGDPLLGKKHPHSKISDPIDFPISKPKFPWDPDPRNPCPIFSDEFGVVVAHQNETNGQLSCVTHTALSFKTKHEEFPFKPKYLNCTDNPVAAGSLVVVRTGYFKFMDKIGNITCRQNASLESKVGEAVLVD